mgnify:FL=1
MAYSIDKVKDKQSDVKRNLDIKKEELNQLEERKQTLLDSGMDIQNSNMDEKNKRAIMELINKELEENSEKGEELSEDMQDDLDLLTEMKDEVTEMIESSKQERKNLENKKSILDKFGMGKNIDDAISEIDDSVVQLDSINDSLLKDEQKLNNISQKLSHL